MTYIILRYEDSEGNTVAEYFSVFSLIQMHELQSARVYGQ